MKEDTDVKFADVVSGDQGMTMMVMLGGGSQRRLEIPMLIFQNKLRLYPIQGLPDDVLGVCCRTSLKGWMGTRVFEKWLSEPRIMKPILNSAKALFTLTTPQGTEKLMLQIQHCRKARRI